ncbi:hypothetical protein NPIL_536011, partial [Nephila pilipes]
MFATIEHWKSVSAKKGGVDFEWGVGNEAHLKRHFQQERRISLEPDFFCLFDSGK